MKRGRPLRDLTGVRFGMIFVLGLSHIDQAGRSFWNCRCDCGNEKPMRLDHKHKLRSCGCKSLRDKQDAADIRIEKQEKRCCTCKQNKAFSAFYKEPRNLDGFCSQCIRCIIDRHRKRKYGVTREQYLTMLSMQKYRCAACEIEIDERAPLDHCHRTGQIRAILCQACNVTLGKFDEDETRLSKLVGYLIKHKHLHLVIANG